MNNIQPDYSMLLLSLLVKFDKANIYYNIKRRAYFYLSDTYWILKHLLANRSTAYQDIAIMGNTNLRHQP
ncbi:hypothetical protein JCM18904_4962 [Vibrio sp. JCM 18904]|nr:hypothetical protein JCM18904_4962 [Vibrio sp. JCM 18904]